MTRRIFASALLLAAAWTLTIKFALPVLAARREGLPWAAHVMWDFWWAAHLALAWQLLRPAAAARAFALAVTWCELVIIAAKFAVFLRAPAWTFWTANWFVNKCYVLALFALMAGWLHATPGGRGFGGADAA